MLKALDEKTGVLPLPKTSRSQGGKGGLDGNAIRDQINVGDEEEMKTHWPNLYRQDLSDDQVSSNGL